MNIQQMIRHPGIPIKSFWLSLHYAPRRFWKFPITASRNAVIKSGTGAELRVGERLELGRFTTRVGEIGQINLDHTVVQLAKGSRFISDGRVTLGPGVRVIVGEDAEVHIGKNTFISANSKVISRSKVDIGDDCAISWDVQILDTDFHELNGQRTVTAPIKIGNHVWISSGVNILKGITIGDGAVIGAGTVVTKDVPRGALAVGNPARIVRKNVRWSL
ncbi:acyltransferase [Alicyclobacillus dauci]|uniref:Acyltransferase n=1 Tax=Alicyclobacillus dauci TaxID=1475485 RepID=A0ABY6Z090_9BACL|nr:acyltransferase [Alicyclobacillus dauci]WAH36129.1 acyltransferase [Alicyclobacillus dauci]